MEDRFESKNDFYEVVGDDEYSKAMAQAIEFFRKEAEIAKNSSK